MISINKFIANPSLEPRIYTATVTEKSYLEERPEKNLEKQDVIAALSIWIMATQGVIFREEMIIKSSQIFWRIFSAVSAIFSCKAAFSILINKNRSFSMMFGCALSTASALHFLYTDYKTRKLLVNYENYVNNYSQVLLGLKSEANPEVNIIKGETNKKFEAQVKLTLPVSDEIRKQYLSSGKERLSIIVTYRVFSNLPLRKRVSLLGYRATFNRV